MSDGLGQLAKLKAKGAARQGHKQETEPDAAGSSKFPNKTKTYLY
jgi:hypothetical protein